MTTIGQRIDGVTYNNEDYIHLLSTTISSGDKQRFVELLPNFRRYIEESEKTLFQFEHAGILLELTRQYLTNNFDIDSSYEIVEIIENIQGSRQGNSIIIYTNG